MVVARTLNGQVRTSVESTSGNPSSSLPCCAAPIPISGRGRSVCIVCCQVEAQNSRTANTAIRNLRHPHVPKNRIRPRGPNARRHSDLNGRLWHPEARELVRFGLFDNDDDARSCVSGCSSARIFMRIFAGRAMQNRATPKRLGGSIGDEHRESVRWTRRRRVSRG